MRLSSPLLRTGAPFVLFVVAGAWGVSYFTSGLVSAKDNLIVKRSERAVTLEEAHKAIMSELSKEMEEVKIKPITRAEEVALKPAMRVEDIKLKPSKLEDVKLRPLVSPRKATSSNQPAS
jgi:hypothetical protein